MPARRYEDCATHEPTRNVASTHTTNILAFCASLLAGYESGAELPAEGGETDGGESSRS